MTLTITNPGQVINSTAAYAPGGGCPFQIGVGTYVALLSSENDGSGSICIVGMNTARVLWSSRSDPGNGSNTVEFATALANAFDTNPQSA